MNSEVFIGLMIPFLGTALGSGCVFFMKNKMDKSIQRALTGFASGVMVAASIWSLLIPAMEQTEGYGKLSFLPAVSRFGYTPSSHECGKIRRSAGWIKENNHDGTCGNTS